MNTSGEPRRRLLTRNGAEPAFSPDGRRIAFVGPGRGFGGDTSVRIANRDGTRQRVLRRGFERAIGSQYLDYSDVAWRPLP